MAIGGLRIEGRIGLSPALLNSLAIARGRDSAPDLVPIVGCSPALEDRPGGRVRGPSLADIVDKGALTGRVGYTHPTPAVRLRPTPWRPDRPAVLEASGAKLWTMAHIPVAWAAPPNRCARRRLDLLVGCGVAGPESQIMDNGAVTPRLGCAPPTPAPGPRPDPSQGRCP